MRFRRSRSPSSLCSFAASTSCSTGVSQKMSLHLPWVANDTRKRPIFWAIVGGRAATPRKLNCKLVLVTHHYHLPVDIETGAQLRITQRIRHL